MGHRAGKGTLENFFLPPFRANLDDLRPLKAKFGTFEHLWGSKTQFRVPQFLVGFTENKSIFGPKKIFFDITKLPLVGLCVLNAGRKMQI